MKLRILLLFTIAGILYLISCKEKIICNCYIKGNDIYDATDSSLQWRFYDLNPTSYYKFEIEEKIPNGFDFPQFSELEDFVSGIVNCNDLNPENILSGPIKIISKMDTIDYEGNKLAKGFQLKKEDGKIISEEVAIDKGELIIILLKKK